MNAHDLFKGMIFLDHSGSTRASTNGNDFAPRYGNRIANAAALGPLTSARRCNNQSQPCREAKVGGCG